jgi:hypothetical protein
MPIDTTLKIGDIITFIAIFLGPMAAFLLNSWNERRKDKKQKKIDIFRTLIANRMQKTAPLHISALNMIEIDFADDKNVLAAWKVYFENLSADFESMSEAAKAKTYNKRERLFAGLVSAIAKSLDLKIEQLDILTENYLPQGWLDNEKDQHDLRKCLIGLLQGQGALPVHVDVSPILEKNFSDMRAAAEKKKE